MPNTPLNIPWQKNPQNNEWFDLLRLDLEAPYFSGKRGVFLIWYAAPGAAKVIKIGSGNLAEQLKSVRSNSLIISYSNNGPLKVSWLVANGVMQEQDMSGVEAFLYGIYSPITGEKPNVLPIPVNPLR